MTTIYIDDQKYEVDKNINLLQACLSLGLNIPYFCWHPALGSVGSCRQCAVTKYSDIQKKDGTLVMSCMTPAIHNSIISIKDSISKKFRKNILELLMINHPHDCPVCSEGGDCHLQDITVMTEHIFRRYRFPKKIYSNQNLGPFISHEMNRCIKCYRCVRYYKDYADGKDFGVYGAHDNIYFGRFEDGTLENEFSGNLVEVCPTGVFTDKTYSRHFYRKWDIQFTPSICQMCSLGCNINLGERYGEICKVENRYNKEINHYFLCDRGRFGYNYINLKNRPKKALKKQNNNWVNLKIEEATKNVANLIHRKKIFGIGSPRASLESNFSLKELVGKENFSIGISKQEKNCLDTVLEILKKEDIYTPSLCEIENYDAILLLGEDVSQTSPRLALSIRQAIKNKAKNIAFEKKIYSWNAEAVANFGKNYKYPLYITQIDKTNLDDIALWKYYAPIENQARLGFSIAHYINSESPKVHNLGNISEKVKEISETLIYAKKPLIISGTHSGNVEILQATYNIAKALQSLGSNVGISFMVSSSNSIGVGMLGGKSLEEIIENKSITFIDTLIILENDIYRQIPKNKIEIFLKKVKNIIVLDHQNTPIMKKANIILPSGSFAESSGTLINQEGRAQRFFKAYDPVFYDKKKTVLDSWRWLNLINQELQNHKNIISLDKIIESIANQLPQFSKIKDAAPNADFRIFGQKLTRAFRRYSGRTAINIEHNIHESPPLQDIDTMFSFSMEGNENFLKSQKINYSLENKNQKRKKNLEISGIRLFEIKKSKTKNIIWYKNIPSDFQKIKNRWIVVPYYHLFGSEEMSQRSFDFQSLIPKPYIVINISDAEMLNIKINSIVECVCENIKLFFNTHLSKNLQSGQVGMPLGIPQIPIYFLKKQINFLKIIK